jgi:hypothetical protein
MIANLYALFSDSTDSTRVILLYGALAGGFIVVAGIVWEAGELNRKTALVIFGICLESFCTWRLFVVDETTFKQLLTHRSLSQDQKDRLAAVAEKFPSLNFQTVTVIENEPWGFVTEVGSFLESRGWHWLACGGGGAGGPMVALPPALGKPTSCASILDGIQINGANAAVVYALASALREPSVVGMGDVRPVPDAASPTVVIMIGSKL